MTSISVRLVVATALLVGLLAAWIWAPLGAGAESYVEGLVTAVGLVLLDLLRAADAKRRSSPPPRPPRGDDDNTPAETPAAKRVAAGLPPSQHQGPPWTFRAWLLALCASGMMVAPFGCGASGAQIRREAVIGAASVIDGADAAVLAIAARRARDCVDEYPPDGPARAVCLAALEAAMSEPVMCIDAARDALRAYAWADMAIVAGEEHDIAAAWVAVVAAYDSVRGALRRLDMQLEPIAGAP